MSSNAPNFPDTRGPGHEHEAPQCNYATYQQLKDENGGLVQRVADLKGYMNDQFRTTRDKRIMIGELEHELQKFKQIHDLGAATPSATGDTAVVVLQHRIALLDAEINNVCRLLTSREEVIHGLKDANGLLKEKVAGLKEENTQFKGASFRQ